MDFGGGLLNRVATVMKGAKPNENTKTSTSASSSDIFVKMALDMLLASKEIKRNTSLQTSVKAALASLEVQPSSSAIDIVFKPLQIACRSGNVEMAIIAIDCFGKLFTYNYWSNAALPLLTDEVSKQNVNAVKEDEEDPGGTTKNIMFVIDAICASFIGETTDEKIQLQIIKALQAALSNADYRYTLHGGPLVKAIRTAYNVFLLSKSADVQLVAQGTVSQMVLTVFARALPFTPTKNMPKDLDTPEIASQKFVQHSKDAFKVFKTLCILSTKAVPTIEGGAVDLRSQPIRSKLLLLFMILDILKTHPGVFLLETTGLGEKGNENATGQFIDFTKDFLFLTLTRNATSAIPPVFEVTYQIFGQVLSKLRGLLKSEICVFTCEIILPILEARKGISWYQQYLLTRSLERVLADPKNEGGRILTEFFLNYDCDPDAKGAENVWERFAMALCRAPSTPIEKQENNSNSQYASLAHMPFYVNPSHGSPALTVNNLVTLSREQVKELYTATGDSTELRNASLRCLVTGSLNPLLAMCKQFVAASQKVDETETSVETESHDVKQTKLQLGVDDFENNRMRKQISADVVKQFNLKPKKGVALLKESNLLANPQDPHDLARFLYEAEGVNKSVLGEFLGEGDQYNIIVMHAFVDLMDFDGLKFVDALRHFLQSFRLPGESQKIDRFMLKFAERYLLGNPASFSTADTAYVLAYSVIMLNTDQYNKQVKKRMTKPEFLRNNRGIDEGKDLPAEVLEGIFDEIARSEIVMKDAIKEKVEEKPATLSMAPAADVLLSILVRKERPNESLKATEDMVQRTEAMLTALTKKKTKGSPYHTATSYEHIRHMFRSAWTPVLNSITIPFQETEDVEIARICLEGFKATTYFTCLFDMEADKKAFISALAKFSLINTLNDAKLKNLEAIKTLLEISLQEGNHLDSLWIDVINCISQLEKLQLLPQQEDRSHKKEPKAQDFSQSQSMTVLVDRIFTTSPKLNGKAIIELVRALCLTSWDEITNSDQKEHPRMYCLQRLVEISECNMNRIRVEWSQMWSVLGEHFEQVGCYPNSNVATFAIDKLRQLAIKFLDIEELPNFKFQKDFLKPFEVIMRSSTDTRVKDMCLVCISQMIQLKGPSLKSGWRSLFACLMRGARDTSEPIVTVSFGILKTVFTSAFESMLNSGNFADYVLSLVEFCKNRKVPKLSLQASDMFRQVVAKLADLRQTASLATSPGIMEMSLARLDSSTNNLDQSMSRKTKTSSLDEEYITRFWSPLLFGLHDIIMNSDLEVRTRCLQYLFEILKTQGHTFNQEFWDLLAKTIILPTFEDLKLNSATINLQNSKFANKEEMSIWLSTTLIQALRQLIDLFTLLPEHLKFLLPDILKLFNTCMTHENESLVRIGATCVQQLVLDNYQRLAQEQWKLVTGMFTTLFNDTTPSFLIFTIPTSSDGETDQIIEPILANRAYTVQANPPDRKDFPKQLSKCVLHLQALQALQDVLLAQSGENIVYAFVPDVELTAMIALFENSYQFAKDFNDNQRLRTFLYKQGYMKQLPNLLKQETMSAFAFISLSIKRFNLVKNGSVDSKVMQLSLGIMNEFNGLDIETKRRSANAWKPIITLILEALATFDDTEFKKHTPTFYTSILSLLLSEVSFDLRASIHAVLIRVGSLYGVVPPS